MLRRHLDTILDNIELVEDCGDFGIVAQSLAEFCNVIDNDYADASDAFQCGMDGGWRNTELEAAIGLVPAKAESEEAPA